MLAASIIRAIQTRLHGAATQKTAIFKVTTVYKNHILTSFGVK
jgi:hypothetical protein